MDFYSALAQPYGLLSNNAETPLTIAGREWKSVTEFVYSTIFKGAYQVEMRDSITSSPYKELLRIKEKHDEDIYNRYVIDGLDARFKQHPTNYEVLDRTRGKSLSYGDKNIQNYLERKRFSGDFINDPTLGKIPYRTASGVIAGAELKLLKDPTLSQPLSFHELSKYAIDEPPTRPKDDPAYLHLANLVPYLRQKLGKDLYEEQVGRFKSALLDTYLDKILAQHYPHIKREDYRMAKNQQRIKEKSVSTYLNQLFELYSEGKIPQEVLRAIPFEPDKSLLIPPRSSPTVDTFVIDSSSRLLPDFMEEFEIGGSRYLTATHYAYSKLFKEMDIDVDVNKYANISALKTDYKRIEGEWIIHKLTKNNELAMTIKFNIPTLAQLLLTTNSIPLRWNDPSDPILGVGDDNRGQNRAGKMLEFLRSKVKPRDAQLTDYKGISDNLFFRDWLKMRGQDYKNTFNMLSVPTLDSITTIYGCGVFDSNIVLTPADRRVLSSAGLTDYQIKLVAPVVMSQYQLLTAFTEGEAIKKMIQYQQELNKPLVGQRRQDASSHLKKIYKHLTDGSRRKERAMAAAEYMLKTKKLVTSTLLKEILDVFSGMDIAEMAKLLGNFIEYVYPQLKTNPLMPTGVRDILNYYKQVPNTNPDGVKKVEKSILEQASSGVIKGVTEKMFIATILSPKTGKLDSAPSNRINYWAEKF